MQSRAIKNFEGNMALLEQLVRFDDRVLDLILRPLERLRDRLVAREITNQHLLPNNLITTLRNIKNNASLKTHYQALYNQWLVLLVSYFGSAVHDLFVDAAADAIRNRRRPAILKEILEAPVEEFAEEHEDHAAFLAGILASGKDISFQDMQSIGRAFTKYFSVSVEKDATVHDIILAQACRHAIVHSGGTTDRKLVNQLRAAQPRNLKPDLELGAKLEFTPSEIGMAASAMRTYLGNLDAQIRDAAI
jgi:hypothetical protein